MNRFPLIGRPRGRQPRLAAQARPAGQVEARRQLEQARSIIDRAIELHPAAEAVIRACREDDPKTGVLGADGQAVREGYRRLREELRGLDLPSWLAADLAPILDHHLELVSLALELAYRPQTERIQTQRHRLRGLGPSAGHLLTLRDQLARELGG
jgi:hypothetical protein